MPRHYDALTKCFFPESLTLLFPTTASNQIVVIRIPLHPVARTSIEIADVPLVTSSAKSSASPIPKRGHVYDDLNRKVGLFSTGSCSVGLESTMVDGSHEDNTLQIPHPVGTAAECRGFD